MKLFKVTLATIGLLAYTVLFSQSQAATLLANESLASEKVQPATFVLTANDYIKQNLSTVDIQPSTLMTIEFKPTAVNTNTQVLIAKLAQKETKQLIIAE